MFLNHDNPLPHRHTQSTLIFKMLQITCNYVIFGPLWTFSTRLKSSQTLKTFLKLSCTFLKLFDPSWITFLMLQVQSWTFKKLKTLFNTFESCWNFLEFLWSSWIFNLQTLLYLIRPLWTSWIFLDPYKPYGAFINIQWHSWTFLILNGHYQAFLKPSWFFFNLLESSWTFWKSIM